MTKDEWYKQLFERLENSRFRSRFHLKQKDIDYIHEKGLDTIRKHAEDFITKREAPAYIPNDGKHWREGDAAGLRHPGGQPPGVRRRRHPHEGSGGAAGNVREKKEYSCKYSRNRLNSPSDICGR